MIYRYYTPAMDIAYSHSSILIGRSNVAIKVSEIQLQDMPLRE